MLNIELPMRIAILGTRGIPAHYGGFETFAEQLSTRLAERGHEVTVFCEGARQTSAAYQGVQLRYISTLQLGPAKTLLYDLSSLWNARKNFDVVYMLGYGSALFCWIPRLWGTKLWINMDGLEWKRKKWNGFARGYLHIMERLATGIADRLIADARAIRDDLRERYSLRVPCDVIPYGCESLDTDPPAEALTKRQLSPKNYYIAVCRFEPENHIREIIDGFAASGSECDLVLVGDHESSTSYVSELKLKRRSKIRFIGPVYDGDELQALRYHCRAYIHGHSVGGTNPSLLEAMGCSNLIIAHDNRFNREVLQDAGLYFLTPQDICSTIGNIDSGLIDVDGFQTSAKNRALLFYSWDRITTSYEQLFRSAKQPDVAEVDLSPPRKHYDDSAISLIR